jgi:aspartate aminotransferase
MISKRVSSISPSLVFEILAKANELNAQGANVINFSAGEPDFATPKYVIDAAEKAMRAGKTKYTATGGVPQLREAICKKLKNDNGLMYTTEQIVASNGCKQSLYNTLATLVDPGDEVIIFAPYWLTYTELIELCGGVPVVVNCDAESNFVPKAEQLEKAITPKTKVIMINSPNNPTGAVYPEKVLRELAAVIEKHNVWVISDEIYEKLIYDGTAHYSIATYSERLYERTIAINGFSKAYAMTGWRIGYTASSLPIAKAIAAFQSHTTQNINTPTQFAGIEALLNPNGDATVAAMAEAFKERAAYMMKRLKAMPHITHTFPQGAFYILFNVTKLGSAHDIANRMLNEAKIAVVPAESFGAPGFIRLSYALSMEEIKTGMDRLENFLKAF